MSQISKKSATLPLRKRLRPTVNLNVAGRRRNNVKDVSNLPDGDADISTKSIKSPLKSNCLIDKNLAPLCNVSNNVIDKLTAIELRGERDLNTSLESRISVKSTASTVILPNCLSDKSVKYNLNESCDSTASTVVVPGNGCFSEVLERTQDGFLNQSLDFDDSRSISSSVSTVIVNGNLFRANSNSVKDRDCSIENLKESSCPSVTSASGNTLLNDKTSVNQEKQLEETRLDGAKNSGKESEYTLSVSSDKDNGYISNNSASTNTSPVCDISCSNADSESVVGDDRSSVFSFTSGNDKLPHKYRRRVNSFTKWLTDAKKEFTAKFVDKKPERSSLRMLDLIYYNPTSNPMKSLPNSSQEVIVSSNEPEANIEEEVDEPEEQDIDKDENNRIPAPRVKVGPNGEIVLDEQSLVIETTQSKKSRKEIANLTVVVDSGSNTTYHTYSKKKRRRCDWSIQETVRFYKALQSIGTDFSLMQSLFPTRSRLDLKAKFKKEERINGHLIEKALRFPSLFDLSELEKEQVSENEVAKTTKKRAKKGRKRSLTALGFDEEEELSPEEKVTRKYKKRRAKTLPQRNRSHDNNQRSRSKRNLDSSSDENESYVEDFISKKDKSRNVEAVRSRPKRVLDSNRPDYAAMENGPTFLEDGVNMLECSSDEMDEETNEVQMDVMQENEKDHEDTTGETIIENDIPSNAPIPLEHFSVDNVQPGSIVLLTTQCPDNPGYQICNVFMVQGTPAGISEGGPVSANPNNCISFPAGDISSSVLNFESETQPS